ncbi:hypothetical protein RF11_03712 [Thelohanellus kitauei]|uniref:HAT C-terminal dimerisation domain-containing protein n=1 Tax=Thelohanellus kitauei TaxID=669202 RepID=A0A0C2JPM1_THEKT|nr:hypothetical protein RF11_03712 [Thelohanellus kitauei]
MKGKDAEYPQLRESLWLSDLAFSLILFEQMEEFNTKHQRIGVFDHEIYQNTTTHIPTLETRALQSTSTETYTNMISALDIGFTRRDFEKETAARQLELTNLQCNITLKEKFHSESTDKFYASLNESKFINLRKMAMKLIVLLESTYIREHTFSTINNNK